MKIEMLIVETAAGWAGHEDEIEPRDVSGQRRRVPARHIMAVVVEDVALNESIPAASDDNAVAGVALNVVVDEVIRYGYGRRCRAVVRRIVDRDARLRPAGDLVVV